MGSSNKILLPLSQDGINEGLVGEMLIRNFKRPERSDTIFHPPSNNKEHIISSVNAGQEEKGYFSFLLGSNEIVRSLFARVVLE